jgi:hypothetical protein
MLELVTRSLSAQYEASLCMLNQCVAACPDEHWEQKLAAATIRWAAYHTLFFADYYLTHGEDAFVLRDLHARGGDEREDVECVGLDRAETLAYLAVVRQKAVETMAAENEASLAAPSGFRWMKFSRLEAHVYNVRHVQHHAGQISAYLRKAVPALAERTQLRWVGSGWRAQP